MSAGNPFTLPDTYHASLAAIRQIEAETGPTVLRVFVPGTAKPKGSKTPKGRRRNGSVILVESADVAPWQSEVARAARSTGVRFAGPVVVELAFLMCRPKKPTYPTAPAGKPDGDKLERAVWDALTESGAIEDDARVVSWTGTKRYAGADELPGVHVTVRGWTP